VRDGEIGEEPGHAGIENGEVLSARLVAERAGEPTLAQAARGSDILPGIRRLRGGSSIRFTLGTV